MELLFNLLVASAVALAYLALCIHVGQVHYAYCLARGRTHRSSVIRAVAVGYMGVFAVIVWLWGKPRGLWYIPGR